MINFEKIEGSVYDRLQEMTEAAGRTAASMRSAPKRTAPALRRGHGQGESGGHARDRSSACLARSDLCCRKGGTVSIPGVYIGLLDKIPMGAAMNKGLTLKMGQTHMKRYTQPLLDKIDAGEIDPSFVITHNRPLEEGPELYKTFRDKEDGCIKVVLKP